MIYDHFVISSIQNNIRFWRIQFHTYKAFQEHGTNRLPPVEANLLFGRLLATCQWSHEHNLQQMNHIHMSVSSMPNQITHTWPDESQFRITDLLAFICIWLPTPRPCLSPDCGSKKKKKVKIEGKIRIQFKNHPKSQKKSHSTLRAKLRLHFEWTKVD